MSLLKKFRDVSMKIQLIVFFLAVGDHPAGCRRFGCPYSGADEALTTAEGQSVGLTSEADLRTTGRPARRQEEPNRAVL